MTILCTERRIRQAVTAATSMPGPFWVRDGRDGPEAPLYVRRNRGALELRFAVTFNSAKPSDPALARHRIEEPSEAYALFADTIESKGYTIA